ncbi:acetyltransferase [Fructilactobacillus florum 8D]|uniref:Acetyltransferase n=2 Tax=Fructilactobacillus florum TaxID=640331 RepID=W9EFQ4_9LACO|nr:GNAT family N-acetyltransferase [Fructilactobacillus florum]EKK20743.1 acetyltransferase [Fructilactobacillus florum 2F]ETO40953.1 acetyltransferase [Fructilactobacillus florum 8D]KRM91176.1 GCN5-like N-acetyltransferase [Fructilactobacillus florum DSM 22689 = JCM 16035]
MLETIRRPAIVGKVVFMKPVLERVTTTADLGKLQDLIRDTFRDTYWDTTDNREIEKYLDTEYSLPKLRSQVVNPDCHFYFLKQNHAVSGYVKLNFGEQQTETLPENSVEVEKLYVLPEYKRQGVGRFALAAAETIAKKQGAKILWLGVWEGNTSAQQFYERVGFRPVGKHTFQLGAEAQTDLILTKSLSEIEE